MADAHTAAKTLLLAAARDSTVAAAAGIATLTWQDRVQPGNKDGFIAGLHRGRLPAVEIYQVSDAWTQLSADSSGQGVMLARWVLRVHSGLPDQDLAEDQCRAVLYAALVAARAQQYFRIGEDSLQDFNESPLGYSLTCDFSVQTTMSRETYETTPTGSTGGISDGGVVGGISKTINWNDTSPVSILALPAGQALALAQLKVTSDFDGTSPSITVGVDGDQERYLAAADSDLAQVDSVWERDVDDPGAKTVKVWIVPGAGATKGQVKVQLITTASV